MVRESPKRPQRVDADEQWVGGLPPPKPILKWAGGKTRLIPDVLARLPERIATYYEPFLGGAAVFFALARENRFEHAILTDKNPELVDVYRAVQQDVESVIEELARMPHSEQAYYHIRAQKPRGLVKRAARTIYLNRTGYNGLYRVNRSGEFNVPYGRYKNPKYCDPPRLRAASLALKGAEIFVSDFEQATRDANKGDAIYFDPPYVPLSPTSNFTAYHREPFGLGEQERLAIHFDELGRRHVQIVLSNSDTPITRELYKPFHVDNVSMPRAINSRGSGRGKVGELLVVHRRPRK
ncbi:MAG: DNA adenine methylase [Polyangiaceae bacterium]